MAVSIASKLAIVFFIHLQVIITTSVDNEDYFVEDISEAPLLTEARKNESIRALLSMVSIQLGDPISQKYENKCSGSILSNRWVLTSANCIERVYSRGKLYKLRIEERFMNREELLHHEVIEVHRHERYSQEKFYIDDIGLVKVDPAFVFRHNLQHAELPKENQDPPVGTVVTAAGWTYPTAKIYELGELQTASVEIMDIRTCRKMHWFDFKRIYNICAGGFATGKGLCGDNIDGVLFAEEEIIGILTAKRLCAFPGYPLVYTKVSSYMEWIKEFVK